MQNGRKSTFKLVVLSLLFLYLGWVWETFPIFILVAFIPLLILREKYQQQYNYPKSLQYLVYVPFVIFLSLLAIHFTKAGEKEIQHMVVYSLFSFIPFLCFDFFYTYSPNRVGLFSLAVFWMAYEYLLLKIMPGATAHCLSNALPLSWMGWNSHIGYLGGSLLIIIANVMLFYTIYDEKGIALKKIKWSLAMVIAIVLIGVIWYGYSYPQDQIITFDQMMSAYSDSDMVVRDSSYLENGEFSGRIALWIGVMMLLVALVKSKINK